jgi:hypothetical protein
MQIPVLGTLTMDGLMLLVIIAQAAIYLLTVIVLRFELAHKVQVIREEEYWRIQADHSALHMMLLNGDKLRGIYDRITERAPQRWRWRECSPEEKDLYLYIELTYDQCARAYALQKKKLIDRETWREWHNWVAELAQHPTFEKVHQDNLGLFDADFQKYVTQLLADMKRKS